MLAVAAIVAAALFLYSYFRQFSSQGACIPILTHRSTSCSASVDETVQRIHNKYGTAYELAASIAATGGSGSFNTLPTFVTVTFHKMASAAISHANTFFVDHINERTNYSVVRYGSNTDFDYLNTPGFFYGLKSSTNADFALLEWTNARAEFVPSLLGARYFRGVVFLRDFRDVIVSGADYHLKTKERAPSVIRDRRWLKYGSLTNSTYQEALSNSNFSQRLIMEMEYAFDVITGSCGLVLLKHPWLRVFRIEEVMKDLDNQANSIARFLFADYIDLRPLYVHALKRALRSTYPHTQRRGSRTGAWRAEFSANHIDKYSSLYESAARTCGYQ